MSHCNISFNGEELEVANGSGKAEIERSLVRKKNCFFTENSGEWEKLKCLVFKPVG